MGTNTVSKELGDALLRSQDNLQRILENMVVLGEPYTEYERLMVMLSYLDAFSDELEESVGRLEERHANVVRGDFGAGANKKNR